MNLKSKTLVLAISGAIAALVTPTSSLATANLGYITYEADNATSSCQEEQMAYVGLGDGCEVPVFFAFEPIVTSNRIGHKIEAGESIVLDVSKIHVLPIKEQDISSVYGDEYRSFKANLEKYPLTYKYEWNTGETTSRITVNPTENTKYTVKVTPVSSDPKNEFGTHLKAVETSVNVVVSQVTEIDELPQAVVKPIKSQIHVGEKVVISGAESTDDHEITRYSWMVNGLVQAVNQNSFEFVSAEAGIYQVVLVVTDSKGQTSQANAVVEVLPNETESDEVGDNIQTGGDDLKDDCTHSTLGDATLDNSNCQAPQLEAKFKYLGGPVIYVGGEVRFDGAETVNATANSTYMWQVNEQLQPSRTDKMVYTFDVPGIHNIVMMVSDEKGGMSTFVQQIPVAVVPHEPFVDSYTGEEKVAEPYFTVTSLDAFNNELELDNTEIEAGQSVAVEEKTPLIFTPGNFEYKVRYYVYKKPNLGLTAVSLDDEDTLCYFDAQGQLDCTLESGVPYKEVEATKPVEFTFAQTGDYTVKVLGTDSSSKLMSLSSVPVKVTTATLSDSTDDNNTANEDVNIGGGTQKHGNGGGGFFDLWSLLMLGGLGVGLRRRKSGVAKQPNVNN